MGRVVVVGLLLVVFFAGMASAALGISPAKLTYDFVPGASYEVEYTVISDRPDQVSLVYTEGALGNLVTVSQERFIGGGKFVATLQFPEAIEKPGNHRIYVVASEKKDDGAQPLGSSVTVRAVLEVFVSYPGQYVDVVVDIPNGNIDEVLPLTLRLESLGTENVTASPRAEVLDLEGNQVASLKFDSFVLESRQKRDFHADLLTAGWAPGEYVAIGKVDFAGQTKMVNKTFLVGSLFVNVTNYTRELVKRKGIQKFFVNVESRWNGVLDEVFAEVNISNEEGSVAIKTPSISLMPWESAELVAFVDTDILDGEYQSEIVVRYAGLTTRVFGVLDVRAAGFAWWLIVLVLVVVAVAWFLRKRLAAKQGKQGEKTQDQKNDAPPRTKVGGV